MSKIICIAGAAVLLIIVGCGGSGGSSASGSTGTTGSTGGTGNTGGGGTPLYTLTTDSNPTGIYAQAPNPQTIVTLNYSGPATDTFTWNRGTHDVGPEGKLTTTSGQPFPTGPTTLRQAVYVGDPTYFAFGNVDVVQVYPGTLTLPNPSEPNASINVPLLSDYVTLPAGGPSAVASVSTDKPLYHPGDTVTVTYHFIPGPFNTSCEIDAPTSPFPATATINGSPVSFPVKYSYGATAPSFNVTLLVKIPSNAQNQFPVSAPLNPQVANGLSGPWMTADGSGSAGGWMISAPFFVHS